MSENMVNTDHVNYQLRKAKHNFHKASEENISSKTYWQGYMDALESLLVNPKSLQN